MTLTDTISRISQLQTQLASLNTAFMPPPAGTASTAAGNASATPTSVSGSPSTSSFASQLSAATAAGTPLAAAAASKLTSGQQQFASRLAADTGLDSNVIGAWLLAEESGGAAQARQAASNNDWLNIGYTDSATYGAADSVWSNPMTAADATAGWLKGQNTIPGYGVASGGIQAILNTAGQPPAAQISALQRSGWASSGYPDLPALYQQVAG